MSTDSQTTRPTVPELREQLRRLPGQRIVDAMQALEMPVRYLLIPNGQELDLHLAMYHDGPLSQMPESLEYHELMNQYLGEALRLTHNLVASVATIIDQTRRILEKNWPDEAHPIRSEFEAGKQVFMTDGRLVVVRGLRNFLRHRTLPSIAAHTTWDAEAQFTSSVQLSTVSLLQWENWPGPAKKYLKNAGDSIELRSLARHYCNEAVAFQNKVIQCIRAYEADTLAPWVALAEHHDARVREVMSRLGQPHPGS